MLSAKHVTILISTVVYFFANCANVSPLDRRAADPGKRAKQSRPNAPELTGPKASSRAAARADTIPNEWCGVRGAMTWEAVHGKGQRLKLVWISLDGFQPTALEPWISKLPSPQPNGLSWLIKKARGRNDLKVINPTVTAPSHISTITCSGAGVHGILDNTSWTGTESVNGFNRPYQAENWIARLRKQGLRVGSALYPSIDGNGDERTADVGITYDVPGSSPQIIKVAKGATSEVTIPDRANSGKSFNVKVTVNSAGVVTAETPWGSVGPMQVAKPVDLTFKTKMNGVERLAAVSLMLLANSPASVVEVSPMQVMPAFGKDFIETLDRDGVFFSGLRDYKMQSYTESYLATMEHRRKLAMAAELKMVRRGDLDALFLYFEDLDALLHGFYRDAANEKLIVDYLSRFDRSIAMLLASIPPTADLVVLGDHGMSAIAYVLNVRKILTEEVASKGYITTPGGSVYFYPPQGDMTKDAPAGLDLQKIAERLRNMELDITGKKIFAKVIVRGTKEAADEGLVGKNLPWIMAFANDGIGFKNSVEDRLLLARARWAKIPEKLQSKYPDTMNNGNLVVPVPAGQHGHFNGLPQMRTRLVLEGPRVGKIPLASIEKTLQLVPAVADAEGWQRPAGCAR